MLEKALTGNRGYWIWVACLLAAAGTGFFFYLRQLEYGLGVTGMSRDVSWGLYIAQFTFLVGIAASAVMLVLPYYLHDYKAFGKITLLGEFLAISAVIMCILFIFVDLGQPARVLNMLLYPSPNSILFWDMIVLSGYLLINLVTGWTVLACEKKDLPPPRWVRPLMYLSIPWAVSIHTVTAFIYAGLPGRSFWLTAIMAPRFLASAFASGPALLILLCLVLRRVSGFDAGRQAITALSRIVAYALAASLFFVGVELFTVFYSQIPEHRLAFQYLFAGLEGHRNLVGWSWTSMVLACAALALLIYYNAPYNAAGGEKGREWLLGAASAAVFVSLWIEKGLTLIIAGFIPSPLERVTEYAPTAPEIAITVGVWAGGFLILTGLYRIFVSVRLSK